MTVVTKTGDSGKTSIIGQTSLSKGSVRFEALGCVDELSSWLGLILLKLSKPLQGELKVVQQDLFRIAAELGSLGGKGLSLMLVGPGDVARLESAVARLEKQMEPLKGLILPGGGNETSASLDVARAVCRRAERAVVRFLNREGAPDGDLSMLVYLNRLSDYLFVMARTLDSAREYARS